MKVKVLLRVCCEFRNDININICQLFSKFLHRFLSTQLYANA